MNEDFKSALQDALIDIVNIDEGIKVILICSHEGYQKAKSSDYDNERKALEIVQELN